MLAHVSSSACNTSVGCQSDLGTDCLFCEERSALRAHTLCVDSCVPLELSSKKTTGLRPVYFSIRDTDRRADRGKNIWCRTPRVFATTKNVRENIQPYLENRDNSERIAMDVDVSTVGKRNKGTGSKGADACKHPGGGAERHER